MILVKEKVLLGASLSLDFLASINSAFLLQELTDKTQREIGSTDN
ncbi:MAG: hypothetical protein QNJ54_35955 [Prochloraceae cyanobacterium]|nr:hypothetical protein [Prochloraceae cyanobacterium]